MCNSYQKKVAGTKMTTTTSLTVQYALTFNAVIYHNKTSAHLADNSRCLGEGDQATSSNSTKDAKKWMCVISMLVYNNYYAAI